MKGTMLVLRPGTSVVDRTEIDGPCELSYIKAGLNDGMLETVPYFNRIEIDKRTYTCVAFCDEDGKGKGLPYNEVATTLWCLAVGKDITDRDHLVGPIVVLIGDKEFMRSI